MKRSNVPKHEPSDTNNERIVHKVTTLLIKAFKIVQSVYQHYKQKDGCDEAFKHIFRHAGLHKWEFKPCHWWLWKIMDKIMHLHVLLPSTTFLYILVYRPSLEVNHNSRCWCPFCSLAFYHGMNHHFHP